MARSGSGKRKLSAAVTVRLSDELATAVAAEAKAAKVSAAGWLRSLAVDMTSAARPEDVQRSRRRRPVHVPAEDLAEVSRLVGKLGTVAGALIQFAKRSREDGDAHLHAEAEAALADLRAIQPILVDVVESLKRTAKGAAKKPAP